MSSLRRVFVGLLGIVILGGSLIATFWRIEWFPYSNYPMYSRIYVPEEFVYLDVVGVNFEGQEVEIPVRQLFYPFGRQPLFEALNRNLRARKEPHYLAAALYNFYLKRKRTRGLTIELKGIRIYKNFYNWQQFTEFKLRENKSGPENPPSNRREVIAEYVQ